jgi:hypothetical protein
MDEILVELFKGLNQRINEFRLKNKDIDIDDIVRSCIMIECYLDGFIKEEPIEVPVDSEETMSIEELGGITRAHLQAPPGHVGPSSEMIDYVVKNEKKLQDRIRKLAKVLEHNKNKPYFPTLCLASSDKKTHGKN